MIAPEAGDPLTRALAFGGLRLGCLIGVSAACLPRRRAVGIRRAPWRRPARRNICGRPHLNQLRPTWRWPVAAIRKSGGS